VLVLAEQPSGAAISQAAPLFFYLLGLITVCSAWAIVLSQNIVRMAVYLLLTLVGVAGMYFMMEAELLAAVQLIVYAGGTLILIVFGVMLTGRSPFTNLNVKSWELGIGLFIGVVMACLLILALVNTKGPSKLAVVHYGTEAVPSKIQFGNARIDEKPRDATFTVRNAGWAMMRVAPIQLSDNTGFELAFGPTGTGKRLPPGQDAVFTVRMSPLETGEKSARVTVVAYERDSQKEHQFSFEVKGQVVGHDAESEAATLPRKVSQVAQVGKGLLSNYVVPFEVAAVLLLVVMIGAAYMARRRAPGEGSGK